MICMRTTEAGPRAAHQIRGAKCIQCGLEVVLGGNTSPSLSLNPSLKQDLSGQAAILALGGTSGFALSEGCLRPAEELILCCCCSSLLHLRCTFRRFRGSSESLVCQRCHVLSE